MWPPRSPAHISLPSRSHHTTLPALLLGIHATLSNPHSSNLPHLAQNIPILHLVSRCICHTCSNRTCLEYPHKVSLINAHKAAINDTESMLLSEPCPAASVRTLLLHLTTTSSQQAAQAFSPMQNVPHVQGTQSMSPCHLASAYQGAACRSHSIHPQIPPKIAQAMLLSLAHSGQYAPPRTGSKATTASSSDHAAPLAASPHRGLPVWTRHPAHSPGGSQSYAAHGA